MKKHIEYLESLVACSKAVIEASKFKTLQEAWIACERGDWMLWLLEKQAGEVGSASRRKLVFVAAQCARLALPYIEDQRVLDCIEACEAYSRGEINMEDLNDDAASAVSASAYSSATYAAHYTTSATALKQCAHIVRKYYPEIKMGKFKNNTQQLKDNK